MLGRFLQFMVVTNFDATVKRQRPPLSRRPSYSRDGVLKIQHDTTSDSKDVAYYDREDRSCSCVADPSKLNIPSIATLFSVTIPIA